MTTNYGARPGLSDAAGKFSGSDLMAIGEHIVAANERARKAESELDAERAAHAETLAALEAISALTGDGPQGEHDEWTEASAFTHARQIAVAALAQARGSRGAS